jgi:hypothetical protein
LGRARVDNFGVGQIVRSEDPELKPGDYVWGYLRTYYVHLCMHHNVPCIFQPTSHTIPLNVRHSYSSTGDYF